MGRAVASPSVRALARRCGIDIDALAERLGRQTIAREDVLGRAHRTRHAHGTRQDSECPQAGALGGEAVLSQAHAYWDVDHSRFGPVTREPVTRLADIAARNLSAAHALIVAVTSHDEVCIDALETARDALKPEAEARGVRLTALAFHIAALARTLAAFPLFNASLSADGTQLVRKHYVHIGIAVETGYGLAVPVLRDADSKGLVALAGEIGDLASRARARKIRPEETGGASMSITSLGGMGGIGFTPVVNPPELAILGISRVRTAPQWNGERFVPALMLPLDLSYDHRVINGMDAARFMTHYKELLSEPQRLLL